MPATGARSGGRAATRGFPKDKRSGQAWAHATRSEGEIVGRVPRPAAAEGNGARAADSTMRDVEQGKGKGTSMAPRRAATERME